MKEQTLQQTKKKAYVKPSISIIKVEQESLLVQLSSQHNPAHHELTPVEPEDE